MGSCPRRAPRGGLCSPRARPTVGATPIATTRHRSPAAPPAVESMTPPPGAAPEAPATSGPRGRSRGTRSPLCRTSPRCCRCPRPTVRVPRARAAVVRRALQRAQLRGAAPQRRAVRLHRGGLTTPRTGQAHPRVPGGGASRRGLCILHQRSPGALSFLHGDVGWSWSTSRSATPSRSPKDGPRLEILLNSLAMSPSTTSRVRRCAGSSPATAAGGAGPRSGAARDPAPVLVRSHTGRRRRSPSAASCWTWRRDACGAPEQHDHVVRRRPPEATIVACRRTSTPVACTGSCSSKA